MNMFGKTTKRFLTVPTIRDAYNSNILNPYFEKVLNALNDRYETEFPEGTPLVCACEEGRFEDVKLFITCMKVVQYLIEQGEADPNIANSDEENALHYAAQNNKKNTELIELLLTHMSLDSINKKQSGGSTPLDLAYLRNDSPIRQEIIALLRSKGGKANCYDANGRNVGIGNGDLNVRRHAVITGSDIEVVREALTKIDDINEVIGLETVLDLAYVYNDSPIKQEIIDLIRSKGGKANQYDANGRDVGIGNGDLND
eukprot:g11415.t1